jgi:hypothetical protein
MELHAGPSENHLQTQYINHFCGVIFAYFPGFLMISHDILWSESSCGLLQVTPMILPHRFHVGGPRWIIAANWLCGALWSLANDTGSSIDGVKVDAMGRVPGHGGNQAHFLDQVSVVFDGFWGWQLPNYIYIWHLVPCAPALEVQKIKKIQEIEYKYKFLIWLVFG